MVLQTKIPLVKVKKCLETKRKKKRKKRDFQACFQTVSGMKKDVKVTVKMNGNLHRKFPGEARKMKFPEAASNFSEFSYAVKSGRWQG